MSDLPEISQSGAPIPATPEIFEPDSKVPRLSAGLAFVLVGLGAGLTWVMMKGESLDPNKRNPSTVEKPVQPPLTTIPPTTHPEAPIATPTDTNNVAKPNQKPDPSSDTPMNKPLIPEGLSGSLPGLNPFSGGPISVSPPTEKPVTAKVTRFVSASMSGAVSSAIAAANKAGGKGIPFSEWIAGGKAVDSAVLIIPTDKLQGFLASAKLSVLDDWSGEADERRSRLERPYRSQLGILRKRRDDLLIKYVETAPDVKLVDEDIALLEETIKGLIGISLPADQVVIKVTPTPD